MHLLTPDTCSITHICFKPQRPRSWSQDLPYFDFSYYINPENGTYPGPCPGCVKFKSISTVGGSQYIFQERVQTTSSYSLSLYPRLPSQCQSQSPRLDLSWHDYCILCASCHSGPESQRQLDCSLQTRGVRLMSRTIISTTTILPPQLLHAWHMPLPNERRTARLFLFRPGLHGHMHRGECPNASGFVPSLPFVGRLCSVDSLLLTIPAPFSTDRSLLSLELFRVYTLQSARPFAHGFAVFNGCVRVTSQIHNRQDLYKTEEIPLPQNRYPPDGMPGVFVVELSSLYAVSQS